MDYIKKEPIVEFITKGLNNPDKTKAYGYGAIEILAEIEYTPTSDVEEVKHGEWIRYWDNDYLCWSHKCSVCGNSPLAKEGTMHDEVLSPYCPNCGAKMDGSKELTRLKHNSLCGTETYFIKGDN